MTQWQTHKLWAEEYADTALTRRLALQERLESDPGIFAEVDVDRLVKDIELDLRFAQVYATLATVK